MTDRQDHRPDGRFAPGNRVALKHGARRNVSAPKLAALIAAERRAVVRDLGGERALSAVASRVVDSYARWTVLARCAFEALMAQGPPTARGRRRLHFDMWDVMDEKANRRAVQLGLERKPPGRRGALAAVHDAVRRANAQ